MKKDLKEIDLDAIFNRCVIVGEVKYLGGMIRIKIHKVYSLNLYKIKRFRNFLAGWIPFTSKVEGFWEIDNTFKKSLKDGIIEIPTSFRNPSIIIQNFDKEKWDEKEKEIDKYKRKNLIFSEFP